MFQFKFCLTVFLFLLAWPVCAEPNVVASIKPIHGLTATIMKGVGSPKLLLDGQSSPHNATLKPSQARQLQEAELLIWVGPELETFLKKPIGSLAQKAKIITLINTADLNFPESKLSKENEKHEDHESEHDEEEDDDDDHHHHTHDRDPHIWLDPQNAVILLREIAAGLSKIDEENAGRYAQNRDSAIAKILQQQDTIKSQLSPFETVRFLTFHDGYGHFEFRFNLKGGSALVTNPANAPGIARLKELKSQDGLRCVFSEPQFNPKRLESFSKDSAVKTAILDPLGYDLEAGPAFYGQLLDRLAQSFATCLSSSVD